MSGEGSLFEGQPYLLTLRPRLISSTIRTSRPILPRLSVGGGRTRPGFRVAHVSRPGPYTSIGRPGFRPPTAGPSRLTCVSRRSRLVAYPDWFKGVVPPGYVESSSVRIADDYGTISAVSPTRISTRGRFFFFTSLLADGPQRYHSACGHLRCPHLSPVHALRIFIVMQLRHSCNPSTNG